jgi:sirohydrochlorin cobaltochelatase
MPLSQSAFFLVAHGSRDPRSQVNLAQWADAFRHRLRQSEETLDSGKWVQTGILEGAEIPLAQQLIDFADQVRGQGVRKIAVLPLFLLAGVHVLEDIPAALAIAQKHLGDRVQLQLRYHLGSHPRMADLLRRNMQGAAVDQWILLSHGTRRPGGKQAIETIATQLGAIPAYWSVPPHLGDCLAALHQGEPQRIGILPYFMGASGILDTISTELSDLELRFNKLNLWIAPPLQPTAIAIEFLMDLWTQGQSICSHPRLSLTSI